MLFGNRVDAGLILSTMGSFPAFYSFVVEPVNYVRVVGSPRMDQAISMVSSYPTDQD